MIFPIYDWWDYSHVEGECDHCHIWRMNLECNVHSFLLFSTVRCSINHSFKRCTDATSFFSNDQQTFQWSNLPPIEKNACKMQASSITNCCSWLRLALLTQLDGCKSKQTEKGSVGIGIKLTRSICSILIFSFPGNSSLFLTRRNLKWGLNSLIQG